VNPLFFIVLLEMNIKQHIIHFLSHPTLRTMESSKQYLLSLRDVPISTFSVTESRSLWFCLLLYKWKSEFNPPDELWQASRTFILETLQEKEHSSARHCINLFQEWKQRDLDSFVNEMVGYYMQVLHLKETIEETKQDDTIQEWRESYQRLLVKIRNAAEHMGFLATLEEKVNHIIQVRQSIVQDTMRRAYWDMLEDDIRHERFDTILCQLTELKDCIKDIIPIRFHATLHDRFDIDYVRQRIMEKQFDHDDIIALCRWVMDSMKEWDSESIRPLYDREIERWEQSIGTMDWSTFIRCSIEMCTVLAVDAKTRISIWRSICKP
jgi:hypothetical protein